MTPSDQIPIRGSARCVAVLLVPIAVPSSMSVVFAVLGRHCPPRTAYNLGFALYWAGWCAALPLWVLGPRSAIRLLSSGRPLSATDAVVLGLPFAGAVGLQLIPHRGEIDPAAALVMVTTGTINAVGEELLWRGVFMHTFGVHVVPGLWSLLGFSAWHLAPQQVLPSSLGRWRFIAGSAVVGLASTVAVRRSGGLRNVVVAHTLTDACGVTAARYRLRGGAASARRGDVRP
jgi:membrane protease YdiL (CAAX protease family)